MNYADADHVAAISDLIEFQGEPIEIDGHKMKAIIERGTITQEASITGLDNREETLKATILNKGTIPSHSAPVVYRGRKLQIDEIEQEGDRVLTLSLRND